jgi:NAD(P)-dependent dehydrogenase (short-subunit alcohol dehydrogenase family)
MTQPATAAGSRVALVTGGSRGIGRAAAIRLAAEHSVVVLTYTQAVDAAQSAAAAIEERGAAAHVIRADLGRPEAGAELVAEVLAQRGRLDTVVNNAGVAPRRTLSELDLELWSQALAVNLTAPFQIIRAAAAAMIEVGAGGAIVNVGSPAARNGGATGPHYAASKAGLIGLTASTSRALAPHGIRVNLVQPLAIDTDMMRGVGAAVGAAVTPPSPMHRFGTPEEAAEVIAFLCSPAASFVSGVSIDISGAA